MHSSTAEYVQTAATLATLAAPRLHSVDANTVCCQLASLLRSIVVPVAHDDAGRRMNKLLWLRQTDWPEAVSSCLAAVDKLWPAMRSGRRRTEAAGCLAEACGAMLATAFSVCMELLRRLPEAVGRLERESPIVLCAGMLWCCCALGLLAEVVQTAPWDAVAGLVLQCEPSARPWPPTAATAMQAAPQTVLALWLSLQMVLERVLRFAGKRQP